MIQHAIRYGATEDERHNYQELVRKHGSPLLVISREKLLHQYNTLKQQLPGVALYYAIKAFPHPAIIEILDEAGANFDVASAGEIDLLQKQSISGRRTIHTHPIKKDAEIRAALRGGSTTFVVDNIDELKKLLPYRQRVGILLRVSFRSETTQIDLSRKFGCAPDNVLELIEQATSLGAHVRGLSFHVGSQSTSPKAHVDAIERCSQIINEAAETSANPMDILDIGGGFPVSYNFEALDIDAYFRPIRQALEEYVPSVNRIIAEPGRYLIAPAVTAVEKHDAAITSGITWTTGSTVPTAARYSTTPVTRYRYSMTARKWKPAFSPDRPVTALISLPKILCCPPCRKAIWSSVT